MMILIHLYQRLNYILFIFNSKLYSNSFRTQQFGGTDGNTFSNFSDLRISLLHNELKLNLIQH